MTYVIDSEEVKGVETDYKFLKKNLEECSGCCTELYFCFDCEMEQCQAQGLIYTDNDEWIKVKEK